MNNQSNPQEQVLSLPKGGGAIKGIGETFQPNLFTGTGNFSIPIATSPGREGFGPQLDLQYCSGNGNGLFGLGWQLSIPRITRKTEKGLPLYNSKDVFVMSGAEDLVPHLVENGDGEWVPKQSTYQDENYTITRYRPRTEGLFARIEKWESKEADGEVYWRATTKENITSIYGRSRQARIFNPDHPEHIFEWLLEETYDAKGNHIYYEYAQEAPTLIINQINEQRRDYRSQRYIRRIFYGNTPDSLDENLRVGPVRNGRHYVFEVLFDYGDCSTTNGSINPENAYSSPPQEGQVEFTSVNWLLRQDPISSFRSGFEVRTLRRCQHVLMFHHLNELKADKETATTLVKSTDFDYYTNPDTLSTFLKQTTVTGYRWDETDQEYKTASMPPLQFKYSEFQPHEQRYEPLSVSNNNLPTLSLNDPNTTLVDLNANGLTDILHTDPIYGFRYWENIGKCRFLPPRSMPQVPAGTSLTQLGTTFADMAGDGRADLLVLDGLRQGFYETTRDTTWDTFKPIPDIPSTLISDPQTRMLDLTGDGLTDILMTREHDLVWFQCLGEQGYAKPQFVIRPSGMTGIYFNDTSNRLRLADMTGDGLNDIVLIHNGHIDYWPNLGYGQFGQCITMACSPHFGINFVPERLFLTDIDGSGCADVVYVDFNQVYFWFNQSGNGWSEQQTIYGTPSTVDTTSLQFADIYGRGTNCLLWSYDYGQVLDSHYKVLDFCGGTKPYLLIEMDNNMGATTRVAYGSSTDHYIEDLENGCPWATSLPFPVQVVDKVEVIDHISRTRLTSEYKYHHGYYDGREREFRGFGMVEQIDTGTFEDYVVGIEATEGKQETDSELYQSPVTTRSWYHMGALQDWGQILQQYSLEYYQQEQYLPEPTLPADLSIDELHECLRAFTGMPLRQEIYSFDGSPEEQNPYTVTENSFDVKLLQPRVDDQHAVFLSVGRESITLNFERNPSDPRIAHSFKLEVDEYGNALKSCAVVYGRKISDETLPSEVTRDQQKLHITYSETDYTPDIGQDGSTGAYRLRVPYESRSYEITGISPGNNLFQLDELKSQIENTSLIAYEAEANGATSQKRILSHSKTLFLDNGLDPLPFGQWDSLGLVYQSYQLAFTPSVVATYYSGKIAGNDFITAGYVRFDDDENWWIPSGTTIYPDNPAEHFYLPQGSKDPLGIETITSLDHYGLLVEQVSVTQATWNVTTAVNDYRILGPVLITDPNKNCSAVEIDTLGMVVKTAIMGKEGSNDGDTLADPTTRMEYELFNWMSNSQPNCVHTFAREQHGSANPRWQESYTYSSGQGEVALTKVQANPGKAIQVNGDGIVIEVEANPRWIGNGRTILNNKGNPVKQYEPYFSVTHEYEDEDQLREIGETLVLHYDPLGRNIRTDYPNGTFAKVEFDPWLQKSFDANDTVKESNWYVERGSPDPQNEEEPTNAPERRAAWLTAKHVDTPSITHFDSLDRPVYAISDYGGGKTATVCSETDLTGRFSKLFDQLQREVASGFTGMAGYPIRGKSAEKWERWTFQNVLGAMVKTWDEYGREFRMEYDTLHRPLGAFVSEDGGETEILFNYLVYGDRHPDAEALNLFGVPCHIFDQAGMVRVPEQDFKGNPKRVERILAKDYKQSLDWAVVANVSNFTNIQPTADPALEVGEVFTASAQYDALNRPTQVTLPDNTVILPTYNEANFLASLRAQIRGRGEPIHFLKEQDYDAKGQRQFAHYGNDVFTKYFYDPQTFRLNNLLTHRSADDPDTKSLQNIHYTYDPVGNITQIRDDAQQTHYFNNAVVKPESKYEYDALYQLIRATGREHASLTNNAIRTHNDIDYVPQLPHQNDAKAVRTYIETYEYDLLGNIKKLKHCFKPQNCVGNEWVRHYRYAYEDNPTDLTNRLIASSLPGDPEEGPYKAAYDYDNYGNMKQMPHLDVMAWNFMDQLMQADLGGGGTAYYVYGLGGQRMRKVIERNENTKLEWIYFGPVQIYRRHKLTSNEIRMERWTVHISDNTGNIAQVDTKTLDLDNEDTANPLNKPLIRYQYSNHLGSVMLETDGDGNPISYEEYHPFGTTSYWSAKPGFDISLKRFRFSGKERDNETGLYYFGARYYAAWLGRWTSSDPAGFASGANLFRYCGNNPIGLKDPVGLQETPAPDHVSYEVSDQAFEANNQVFENGQPSVDDFRKIHSDIGSSFDSRVNAENARIRSEPYEYLEKTKRPGHELPSYELKKGKNWILEATFQNGPSDITNNTLPNSTSTDMPSLEGNNSGAAVGTAGHGIIKAAPKGPTLRVPNTYDAIKLRAYAKGTVEGRIGRVSNTKPIRNDAAHKAGERAFKSSSSRPQGMAADHIIELQHDLSRRSGTSAKDFRWQDSRLNKSEGAKSYHLQKGVAPETRYGYVVKEANAGKWYAKPGARAVGRGLGGVLTVYGAYKSTEAVMDAASNDIKNPEYLGQGTAREVARQTAGWAGGLALGAKGAAVGAALGAPLFGAGAIVGGIVGGFVGGAIGFISGSTIADVTMEAVTSITGVERYVPSYAR